MLDDDWGEVYVGWSDHWKEIVIEQGSELIRVSPEAARELAARLIAEADRIESSL